MILSDNGISKVYREGEWVYKRQPKFMTDNEIWCLEILCQSGFVPYAEQVEIELIRLRYIKNDVVTNCRLFRNLMGQALAALNYNAIRHGDLTEKNILVNGNWPYIIDFSESRLMTDPRKDKRPEGDDYWIEITMERLCR